MKKCPFSFLKIYNSTTVHNQLMKLFWSDESKFSKMVSNHHFLLDRIQFIAHFNEFPQ